MSYCDVIKLDTALAKNTLKTMDEHGAVVPPNLSEVVMFISQPTM